MPTTGSAAFPNHRRHVYVWFCLTILLLSRFSDVTRLGFTCANRGYWPKRASASTGRRDDARNRPRLFAEAAADADVASTAPEEWPELVAEGDAAFRNNHLARARQFYERARALQVKEPVPQSTECAEVLKKIGDTYVEDSDAEKALASYQAAVNLLDAEVTLGLQIRLELFMKIGSALSETGDVEGALAEFEAALRLLDASNRLDSTQAAEVLQSIGDLHVETGDLETGLESYELACSIREAQGGFSTRADASLLVNMGAVLAEAGDYYDAVERFRLARGIFEAEGLLETASGVGLLTNLGVALSSLGDASGALVELSAARGILEAQGTLASVDGRSVLMALGDVHTELDNFEDSIEAFETVIALSKRKEAEVDVSEGIDVDALFEQIEGMRSELRHRDAAKLFGTATDPFDSEDGLEDGLD